MAGAGAPAPTAEEMNHLIEDRVRQEVLYREGLALGLDQGDEIIKRRMVQKMDFLAEDLSALQDPDPAELRSWFEKNAARFTVPGRLTFRHLYFSPDRRGTIALAGASAAKTRLAGKRENWQGAATLGDPFMFQDRYTGRSLEQVSAAFGGDFARALFTLPVGSWQGPIESGAWVARGIRRVGGSASRANVRGSGVRCA